MDKLLLILVLTAFVSQLHADCVRYPPPTPPKCPPPPPLPMCPLSLPPPIHSPPLPPSCPPPPPTPKCPKFCPLNYQPICAGSCTHPLKTFGNRCELTRYNCVHHTKLVVVYPGKCKC